MIFAGMLGVYAMAVQNALVRLSLTGAPLHGGDDDERHQFHYEIADICSAAMRRGLRERAIGPGALGRQLSASFSAVPSEAQEYPASSGR